MSSPAIVEKKCWAVKNCLAVVLRSIMPSFDKWAGKKIKAAQKMGKLKLQGQTKSNLGPQFETNLSRMYDEDGNPRSTPVQWNKETFRGH
jgi:hypothetical protein